MIKKYNKISFLLFTLLLAIVLSAKSQSHTIKGRVTDKETKKPIPFVNIGIKEDLIGTVSDMDGMYSLQLKKGDYTLIFSSIEYEKVTMKISLNKEKIITINAELKSTVHNIEGVEIASKKFDQKIEESVNTVDVLKPKLIESKNTQSIDKIVDQVPGVAIVDNEPQFRGGSGYSSGLGSRVMIMIDDMPLLRADAQRPVWDFMPVELVEQIDIIKGASSVLFGSSALNGAINVRTKYPKVEPETNAEIHTGIYNTPKDKYKKVWEGFNPITYGFSFSHARMIKNFDLVLGGNFSSDPGFIATPPHDPLNPSVNNAEFNRQLRLNFNTRFRSKKIENLTYGINGNFMIDKNAQTYIWYDADTNIYRSYPDAYTNFSDLLFYIDPYIKYYTGKSASHDFRNRIFYTNSDATNNQSSRAIMYYDEYQFKKKFKKLGNLLLTTGVMNLYCTSYSEIFSGIVGVEGLKCSENAAAYLQLEKKFFNRLSILLGARYEYYNIDKYEKGKPIFRAGVNYRLLQATFVRASYGEGFRFPSIGERYIATTAGNFGIYPNPQLEYETSQSYELGIKQLFKIKKFVGMIDLSGFLQNYQNYIEFNAAIWGTSQYPQNNLGYKFLNTADARVLGAEISVLGDGELAKGVTLTILAGYTYSLPQCTEPHKVYYYDKLQPKVIFNYIETSTDTTNYILKYRMQHLAKFDIELGIKKIFIGFTANYYSFMQNMDNLFYDFDRPGYFPTGIVKYRKTHDMGDVVMDARAGINAWSHFKFSLIINNILNTEYSLRPCKIESPRTFTIQVSYKT